MTILDRLFGSAPVPMASPTDCYHLTGAQLDALETGLLYAAAHWRDCMQRGERLSQKGTELYLRHSRLYQEAITLENVLETLHGTHGTLDLCRPKVTK